MAERDMTILGLLVRGLRARDVRTALITTALVGLARVAAAQVPYEVIHEFPPLGPLRPYGLTRTSDGDFIGVTGSGGIANQGTVFRMTPEGTITVLHSFTGNAGLGTTDGANPSAGVIEASDGNFYGTTTTRGTIFRITPNGTLTTLYTFAGALTTDLQLPLAELLEASDGNFYGTTYLGGLYSDGTVFRMTPAGVVTILHSFEFNGPDGYYPASRLVQASDGYLYGTAVYGGPPSGGEPGWGTVFRIALDGTFTVLHTFSGTDGAAPGSLIQGSDGTFYGITAGGFPTATAGTIFSMTPGGTVTVLHTFSGGVDGGRPFAALTEMADGRFIGTTTEGGIGGKGTVFTITPDGAFAVLHSFLGDVDGAAPNTALVDAGNGHFYGATLDGGSASRGGTVYRINSDGDISVLHTFRTGPDGSVPNGALVQGDDGSLYGTTTGGGDFGNGTVFKVSSDGALTVLHEFDYFDGSTPGSGVISASDGDFYGTTILGGASNLGTVYRMTPEGALTVLHEFGGAPGGAHPLASLAQGDDGRLYGTTYYGGASGFGTVFSLDVDGTLAVLHSFAGGSAGGNPIAGLIQVADGSFYGTTSRGGSFDSGILFKMTAEGSVTVLHSFGAPGDGAFPVAGVVQAMDGSLYGTTLRGGATGNGTVFKVAGGGAISVVHSFTGGTGGAFPGGALIQATDGYLYGTTISGGASGQGTVFKFSTSGVLLTLQSFTGEFTGRPFAALVQASDGHFYGTAAGSRRTPVAIPGTGGAVFRLVNVPCEDTLALTYADGTLNLGFTLMSSTDAMWGAWLVTEGGAVELWSVQIPAVPAPVSFNVPLSPFPMIGTAGVFTTLSSAIYGTICADWQTVDTSAPIP
jgi:uncharacterized repeat protein (TIGR03803 family)